jgi:hypothetical protein
MPFNNATMPYDIIAPAPAAAFSGRCSCSTWMMILAMNARCHYQHGNCALKGSYMLFSSLWLKLKRHTTHLTSGHGLR